MKRWWGIKEEKCFIKKEIFFSGWPSHSFISHNSPFSSRSQIAGPGKKQSARGCVRQNRPWNCRIYNRRSSQPPFSQKSTKFGSSHRAQLPVRRRVRWRQRRAQVSTVRQTVSWNRMTSTRRKNFSRLKIDSCWVKNGSKYVYVRAKWKKRHLPSLKINKTRRVVKRRVKSKALKAMRERHKIMRKKL